MTSVAEHPGAPAVILLREEVDDDMNNMEFVHERLKILTEAGREYANIEIPYSRRSFKVGGISGQTTHADGSVVPFEGKPFDKVVLKSVQLGRDLGDSVEVVAGLSPADRIINNPPETLAAGDAVRVAQATSQATAPALPPPSSKQ